MKTSDLYTDNEVTGTTIFVVFVAYIHKWKEMLNFSERLVKLKIHFFPSKCLKNEMYLWTL